MASFKSTIISTIVAIYPVAISHYGYCAFTGIRNAVGANAPCAAIARFAQYAATPDAAISQRDVSRHVSTGSIRSVILRGHPATPQISAHPKTFRLCMDVVSKIVGVKIAIIFAFSGAIHPGVDVRHKTQIHASRPRISQVR